jgi:hypothetical protein
MEQPDMDRTSSISNTIQARCLNRFAHTSTGKDKCGKHWLLAVFMLIV